MTLPTISNTPDTGTAPSRLPRFLAAALTVTAGLAASVAVVAPAHAKNPAGPSDPIGAVESIATNTDGTFTVTGWAADPDTQIFNATVLAFIAGRMLYRVVTSVARS